MISRFPSRTESIASSSALQQQQPPLVIASSWQLRIQVHMPSSGVIEHTLRVTGDTHIGGLIYQLVEQQEVSSQSAAASRASIPIDWSDYALWWPAKNMWLKRTKYTLDHYELQADALLHFTRMHKVLCVQLPDRRVVELDERVVDFSASVFEVTRTVCDALRLAHAEELSLLRLRPWSSWSSSSSDALSSSSSTTKSKRSASKQRRASLTSGTMVRSVSHKGYINADDGNANTSLSVSSLSSAMNNNNNNNSINGHTVNNRSSTSSSLEAATATAAAAAAAAAAGAKRNNKSIDHSHSLSLSPLSLLESTASDATYGHLMTLHSEVTNSETKKRSILDKIAINSR